MKKGKVGDGIIAENASWSFGGENFEHFSTHVKRSVPFYEQGHQLICSLSDFFVQADSICYELGTSVGALIYKLAERHSNKSEVRWIGIDKEEPMIAKAKTLNPGVSNVELVVDDINLFAYEKCDLIVAYYVIQFIPPRC